ncbi:MAG TPA: hypothetical protein VF574_11105 [Allosphingosinicella sp.]
MSAVAGQLAQPSSWIPAFPGMTEAACSAIFQPDAGAAFIFSS